MTRSRISELDLEHRAEENARRNGTFVDETRDQKILYTDYHDNLPECCIDYVCSSCGRLLHDRDQFHVYETSNAGLQALKRPSDYPVHMSYSYGISDIDNMDVMIDCKSVRDNGKSL